MPTPSRCSSRRRPAIGPTRTSAPTPPRASQRRSIPASRKGVDALRAAHIRDYRQLFDRVTLELGPSQSAPTDERVRAFADGDDPGLAALYFQYGRYLLIASSRTGSQPANLQGLWNESMSPPWGSKYTININTEMNYWPALSTNLVETMDPLTAMVSDLSVTGARTAREMYGARGWVAHHNTDLWRATGPIDGAQWGLWPTGGAWLTLPLWDRYEYTGDRRYLQRIYPLLKGAAQFFLDTLVEEPTHGWLVTSPSLSPENAHPFGTSLTIGPTMDGQILRELFGNAIEAARTLGIDTDLQQQWSATRARLAPLRIGSAGQLQEWLDDWDMQAPEIHHRHVSHLFGLFPGHDIDVRRTPELAAAVRRSLEIRGDQATGWATAWRINLWARLADGNHAYDILQVPARPRTHLPQHVRRASAVSDRRQLRRHLGNRRDAVAVRRWRDPPAAGAARRVACRPNHRPQSAQRIRDRPDVEQRRARARDRSFAARTAAACASRRHAAHFPDLARSNAHAGRRGPAAGPPALMVCRARAASAASALFPFRIPFSRTQGSLMTKDVTMSERRVVVLAALLAAAIGPSPSWHK